MLTRSTAAAALALLATTAGAQWSTNAWPAWQYPRAGSTHATQAWGAVWERDAAWRQGASTSGIAYPSLWRSQRANIIALKTALKIIVTNYVYSTATNVEAVAQSIQATLNAATASPYYYTNVDQSVWTRWTVDDMLQECRLPTNFFDYTPWRGLNGLGPFTNDAAVGRPHGWAVTNGGDYFPTNRAAWYTTDYGWDGVKAICDRLRYRAAWEDDTYIVSDGYYKSGWEATWDAAQAAVTNAGTPTEYYGVGSQGRYQVFSGPVTNWSAEQRRQEYGLIENIWNSSSLSTGLPYMAAVFLTQRYAQNSQTNLYNSCSNGYDAVGSWPAGLMYGWQVETNATLTSTGSFFACRFDLGVGSYAAIPWCPNPSNYLESASDDSAVVYEGYAYGHRQVRGGLVASIYVVIQDLAGAFRYKP